jgi:very-short-patch-repair endonuclease
VLRREQLIYAGLTSDAIDHRVEQGRLQYLWRPVYLVGPGPPHPLSLAKGGVLTCTGDGFISNGWANYLWGFAPVPSLPVDVTVMRGSRRGRRGKVVIHLSRTLEPRDLTTRHGIPVTTAARALLDVAANATIAQLERLFADAHVAKVVTEAQIKDVLQRAGRHRGAPKLGTILRDTPGVTLSDAERILRRLLREAGIEQPITNHPIGRYKADFCWPAKKLIVEFDGFGAHGHTPAFHNDRKRNAEITAAGYSVMQVTWRQLTEEPYGVIARIAVR